MKRFSEGGMASRKTPPVIMSETPRCVARHCTLCSPMLQCVFLLLLLSCFSCREPEKRIVSSIGLPSELLLVVDKEIWNSDLSDSLNQLLKGPVPGLMQNEPFFRVMRIFTPDAGKSYTTMHSKLFVRLDPSLERPMTGISRDVVARPQIEVTVAAPSLDALRAYLYIYGPRVRQYIADAQIEMRAARLRRKHSQKVASDLRQVMDYTIMAPEEIGATKKADHFLWAGTNRNEKDLNLVIYSYPWDGTEVRTRDYFIVQRDSVMKAHIPGSNPDQWMQTTYIDGNPIVFSEIRDIDGRTMQEVRGLWEMRNGALGGPFVSLVSIDTASSRVVVAEGFVYSPSTDKRDLIRTLEASLRTLKKTKSE